jgi:hypothetical protein
MAFELRKHLKFGADDISPGAVSRDLNGTPPDILNKVRKTPQRVVQRRAISRVRIQFADVCIPQPSLMEDDNPLFGYFVQALGTQLPVRHPYHTSQPDLLGVLLDVSTAIPVKATDNHARSSGVQRSIRCCSVIRFTVTPRLELVAFLNMGRKTQSTPQKNPFAYVNPSSDFSAQ